MGVLVACPAACGRAPATAAALAAFADFQHALFAQDADAVRALVTAESRPVVAELPWQRLAARRPLVALDATDERGSFHVAVREADGERGVGTYVVVRENGRMVVDLLASAALCAVPTATTTSQVVEPRELTPADFDELRRQGALPPDAARR